MEASGDVFELAKDLISHKVEPERLLTEQPFHVIDEIVQRLMAQKHHNVALTLVQARSPEASNPYYWHLVELEYQILFMQRTDDEGIRMLGDLIDNNFEKMPWLPLSCLIWGQSYFKRRLFTKALQCVDKGLSNAEGKILVHLRSLKEKITEERKAMAKTRDNQNRRERREKQRALEKAKEDHQENNTEAEAAASENEEPLGDVSELASEGVDSDEALKTEAKPEAINDQYQEAEAYEVSKFVVPFNVEINDSDFEISSKECFLGSVSSTPFGPVSKSFIKTESSQVTKIEELTEFCLSHQSLLSVQHGFRSPGNNFLLMTEGVYSIEEFFQIKLKECSPKSKQIWWEQIKEIFWSIFRDIVRGMMHIFASGSTCGNVSFNLFVTKRGEGRVLPFLSTEKRSALDDLTQLVSTMNTTISSPFSEDGDLSFLPYSLVQFFYHIGGAAKLLKNGVTPEFVIDHPYFWSIEEKIDFIFKLRQTMKLNGLNGKINSQLRCLHIYNNWRGVPQGVYKEVLNFPRAHPYSSEIDIVRYSGAVYTHVNEGYYKQFRPLNKKLSPREIERDLTSFFPCLYEDLFTCVCKVSMLKRSPSTNDRWFPSFKNLSSVYSREIDS